MEKRIPVTNNTAMPLYVGSNLVPPGETRDFPESQVPPHLRPAEEATPEEETQTDPLAELLAGSVKDIAEQIGDLSDEDLARLGDLEQLKGDTARKTLLSAIAEETLKRAEAALTPAPLPEGEGS